jgi:hypothetical protein
MEKTLELAKKYGFYVYANNVNSIREIYKDNRLKIYLMEGVAHNIHWLQKLINKDSYFYAIIPHATYPKFYEHTIDFLEQSLPNSLGITQIIWLANTEEQLIAFESAGLKAIFCNHNCWLDERLFRIENCEEERIYDLVLNCRPETMKNPYLAIGIKNLAVIKGINHNKDTYWDLTQLNPNYINDNRLSVQQVNVVLNKSKVGGIFSDKEGACYSSSEFHLCGLPVLSVPSQGGRDVWYSNSNSIVFEKSHDGLKLALNSASKKLESGEFSRSAIRSDHIQLANKFIQNFKKSLSEIFAKKGVIVDIDIFYNQIYFHKMTKYGDEIFIG